MEIDKTFDERIIVRLVVHIPFFRIVNLLWCGGHFSSITFIDDPSTEVLICWTFLSLKEPYKVVLWTSSGPLWVTTSGRRYDMHLGVTN